MKFHITVQKDKPIETKHAINIPEFDIKHVVRFTTHYPCMQHYNLIKYQIFLTLLRFGLLSFLEKKNWVIVISPS